MSGIREIHVKILVLSVSVLMILSACNMRTDFEEFAYQGCIKEGKYPDKICACNAKNLDVMLTDDEKVSYKKASIGDVNAVFEMIRMSGKLLDVLQKCI